MNIRFVCRCTTTPMHKKLFITACAIIVAIASIITRQTPVQAQTVPTIVNQPPVITGVSGPTSLKVNETGTWSVTANDPENGYLSYTIDWGDTASAQPMSSKKTQQQIKKQRLPIVMQAQDPILLPSSSPTTKARARSLRLR